MGEPYPLSRRIDRYFSIRPRSILETTIYLKHRVKLSEKETEKQIELLIRGGLLNDVEFASWWVTARLHNKPKSIYVIKKELEQKGITPDIINEVFRVESTTDIDSAGRVLQKKAPRYITHYKGYELRQKLTHYLMSKGFSYDTAKFVVEKYLTTEYNTS